MTLFEWAVVILLANIGWALWRIKSVLARIGVAEI